MRRFVIWSVLSVIVGLALAGVGAWAYDHFYARFQPTTLDRNQAAVERLLASASWVSPGGGDRPLYIVGYRDHPATIAYLKEEAPKLRAAGVDVRAILFAGPDEDGGAHSSPAERATIAQLWLSRDLGLFERWIATPKARWTADGIPAADGDLARTAVVEGSRRFASDLEDLMRRSGARSDWPLVVWRDGEGFLKTCACADRRSWTFVRDDVGAPESVGEAGAPDVAFAPPPGADEETAPAAPTPVPLPYPNLTSPTPGPAMPAAPDQPGRTENNTPPSTRLERKAPSGASPPRPSNPGRPGAEPPLEEDTRFY